MSPRFNYLQGYFRAWLIWQSTLFPNQFPFAEKERFEQKQGLDRLLGTNCAFMHEGQIFAKSVLKKVKVRRAFVSMADRRCTAQSAPALLVGACMGFRGASVINALQRDALTYPFCK